VVIRRDTCVAISKTVGVRTPAPRRCRSSPHFYKGPGKGKEVQVSLRNMPLYGGVVEVVECQRLGSKDTEWRGTVRTATASRDGPDAEIHGDKDWLVIRVCSVGTQLNCRAGIWFGFRMVQMRRRKQVRTLFSNNVSGTMETGSTVAGGEGQGNRGVIFSYYGWVGQHRVGKGPLPLCTIMRDPSLEHQISSQPGQK